MRNMKTKLMGMSHTSRDYPRAFFDFLKLKILYSKTKHTRGSTTLFRYLM
jgi:hypothetical protein